MVDLLTATNQKTGVAIRRIVLRTLKTIEIPLPPLEVQKEKEEWQPFLQNTFGIFQNRKSFKVVLRFTPERSRWIKGEMWHEAQTEMVQDDGSLVRHRTRPKS